MKLKQSFTLLALALSTSALAEPTEAIPSSELHETVQALTIAKIASLKCGESAYSRSFILKFWPVFMLPDEGWITRGGGNTHGNNNGAPTTILLRSYHSFDIIQRKSVVTADSRTVYEFKITLSSDEKSVVRVDVSHQSLQTTNIGTILHPSFRDDWIILDSTTCGNASPQSRS